MNNIVTIAINGEDVFESFSNVLYIISDRGLNPKNCVVEYDGTFGDDINDTAWFKTVPNVISSINKLVFTNYNSFTDLEKSVVSKVINKYNINKDKIVYN